MRILSYFMQCLPQKCVLMLSNWLRHKASCFDIVHFHRRNTVSVFFIRQCFCFKLLTY